MLQNKTSKWVKGQIREIKEIRASGGYVCGFGCMFEKCLKMELGRRYGHARSVSKV